MPEFKSRFIERYSKLTDFKEFKEYSLSFLRRSIRVNTLKISVNELKKRLGKKWNLKQFERIFKSKKRTLCAPPAPAHGLFLEKVIY